MDAKKMATTKKVQILITADLNLTDEERSNEKTMELIARDLLAMLKRTIPRIDVSPTDLSFLKNIDFEMAGDNEGEWVWKKVEALFKIKPKHLVRPGAPLCCGQPMKLYSSSISHDAYHCENCGKAVQKKGGWGSKETLKDGFENRYPLIPEVN